jgi:hypothetical protein
MEDFVFENPTPFFSCPLFTQSDPLRDLLFPIHHTVGAGGDPGRL